MCLIYLVADLVPEVELRPKLVRRHGEARVQQHGEALRNGSIADGKPRLILAWRRARRQRLERDVRLLLLLLNLLLGLVIFQSGWRLVTEVPDDPVRARFGGKLRANLCRAREGADSVALGVEDRQSHIARRLLGKRVMEDDPSG